MQRTVDTADTPKTLTPYLIRFTLAYLALSAITALIFSLLEMDGSSGVSAVVLFSAGFIAVDKFIRDHKRPPEPREQLMLTLHSFSIMWVISLVTMVLLGYLLLDEATRVIVLSTLSEVGSIWLIGGFIVLSLITFGLLWLAYGWMARKHYATLCKAGKLEPVSEPPHK
ncbi:MAG: ABZJ_00895 family protein [Pseudomonadales bacterium]|nr:ABZJ_00895 family protein [Pseudomonadales bacterium]